MTAAIRADVAVAEISTARPRSPQGIVGRGFSRICRARAALTVALLTLLLALGLSSCGRKKVVAAPPLPQPARVPPPVETPPEPVSEPQTTAELPEPQPVPPEAVPRATGPLAGREEPREPPTGAPPEREPRVQANETAETPPPDDSSGPTPVPTLGQILSLEERRAYNEMVDRSIEGAQQNLAKVVGRPLRPEQSAAVRRIRAFMQQAAAARERDLALAKNLADRALLLAQDLARSFP